MIMAYPTRISAGSWIKKLPNASLALARAIECWTHCEMHPHPVRVIVEKGNGK